MNTQREQFAALNSAFMGKPNIQALIERLADKPLHEIQKNVVNSGAINGADFLTEVIKAGLVNGASNLDEFSIDETVITNLGVEYFQAKEVIPLSDHTGARFLATAEPFNVEILEEASFLAGVTFSPLAVASTLIRATLSADQDSLPSSDEEIEQLDTPEEAGETVRIVDGIFVDALSAEASDIHLEPSTLSLGVRFRVHGVLRPYDLPKHANSETIVARIKVLAGMNVSERRLPQDGRIIRAFGGRRVELRVATLPTVHGEAVVCRVLDPNALRLGWEKLGFEPRIESQILDILAQPAGLFAISGPTGSGKTTTLYTALNHLNETKRKIITVEDPVEYDLPGIEQVQVNPAAGADFATILRATLRHDPDVLMIGEIRDSETVQIACRAALIGRLVLATIHASSAEAVVSRMVELGASTGLLDQVLLASLSQRLVPVECAACEGVGCGECLQSGVNGRRLDADLVANDRL